MKQFFLSALLIAAAAITGNAQTPLKLPALSPTQKISQDFSLSNIEISYSRPSLRGRKIFGDLVPYGKVWRTGANAATRIKIGENVDIAGHKVKAGEYALYTIPGRDQWEVILNNAVGNWGTDGYSRDSDVARFFVKPITIEGTCQTFTIFISDITFTSCRIELVWESTKIIIPVKARNEEAVETNIDKAINHPAQPPYFQAANYYYETDQKMETAKTYVDKALEQNPKAYYMWYLKARIEKKLGNREEAVSAAKKSMEAAKGTAFEGEYMHNNQKLIDDIKKSRHRQEIE